MTAAPSRTVGPALAAALGAVLLAAPTPASAQAPPAAELLRYAGSYVGDFIARFSNVVAEEIYEQRSVTDRRRRQLRSDYLIVQIPETNDWVAFRDVLEADGRPVRDGGTRLLSLLLDEPSTGTLERGRAIAEEGARFNLEGIGTLNEPLLVLALLQAEYRDRFVWTVAGSDAELGPDVWRLQFEEVASPTVLRTSEGGDLPAAGAAWIEALTGRVLQTELRVLRSEVVTRFAPDPQFGIAVPVEMREVHFLGSRIVQAEARYGRFRSFTVQTSESFDDPPDAEP